MNKDIIIKTLDGKPYDVPVQGSLGLLALGYVGLIAWRDKIKANQAVSDPTEKKHSS